MLIVQHLAVQYYLMVIQVVQDNFYGLRVLIVLNGKVPIAYRRGRKIFLDVEKLQVFYKPVVAVNVKKATTASTHPDVLDMGESNVDGGNKK